MDRRTFLLVTSGAAAASASCSRPTARVSAARGGSTVAIAAAANLVYALDGLNREFAAAQPAVTVRSTVGASGSLFAQLQHGAPFDLFLSADTEYPSKAVAAGLANAGSLRTFATGRLVAWTTRRDIELADLRAAIGNPRVRRIAVAQPQTAPYGRAAESALESLGVLALARPKLVYGESIAQTAQFVETGNADLGFVALSLVRSGRLAGSGRWIEVPPAWYANVPLAHAAVLTRRGAENASARRYLTFLLSDDAKRILLEFGYGLA